MEIVDDELPSTSTIRSAKKKIKKVKRKVVANPCTKRSFNKSLSYHSISQLKHKSVKYKKQIEVLSNNNKGLAKALAEAKVNLAEKEKTISDLQKTNAKILFFKARMKEMCLTIETLQHQLCEFQNFMDFDTTSSLTSNSFKTSEKNSSGINKNLSEPIQNNSSYFNLIKEFSDKNSTDSNFTKRFSSTNINDDRNKNIICNMSVIDEISLDIDDQLPPIICLEDEVNEKLKTREEKRSHSNKNSHSLGDHTPPSPELHFKSFSNMKLRRSSKQDKMSPSNTIQNDVHLNTQNNMSKLSNSQEPTASKIPLKLKTPFHSVNLQLDTNKITKNCKQSNSRKSKQQLKDNIDIALEEINVDKTQIRRTTFVVNSNQNKTDTDLNLQTNLKDDDIIALKTNSIETFNTRRGTYVITNNINKNSNVPQQIEQENESNHQISLTEQNTSEDIPNIPLEIEAHPISPKNKLCDEKVEASLPPPTEVCSNIPLELLDDMELTECINCSPITQDSAAIIINPNPDEQEQTPLLEDNTSTHLLNANINPSVMIKSPKNNKIDIVHHEEIISENEDILSSSISQNGNKISDFNNDLISPEMKTKSQKQRENSKSTDKLTKKKSNAKSNQRKFKSDGNKKSSSELDKKINKVPSISNTKKLSGKNTIVVNAEIHHHYTPTKPDLEIDYQSPLFQPSLVLVDCFGDNTDRELLSNALKNQKPKTELNVKTSSETKNNLQSKLIDDENIESIQIKEMNIIEDISSLSSNNGIRRKRSKNISYKEPSLNRKLRRC